MDKKIITITFILLLAPTVFGQSIMEGLDAIKASEYESAIDILRVVATDTNLAKGVRAKAYLYIGIALNRMGQPDGMLANFNEAIQILPGIMLTNEEATSEEINALENLKSGAKFLTLTVLSNPKAYLLLDGQLMDGTTPKTLTNLAPGEHTIIIKADGYEDLTRPVHLTKSGDTISVELKLITKPKQTKASAPTVDITKRNKILMIGSLLVTAGCGAMSYTSYQNGIASYDDYLVSRDKIKVPQLREEAESGIRNSYVYGTVAGVTALVTLYFYSQNQKYNKIHAGSSLSLMLDPKHIGLRYIY